MFIERGIMTEGDLLDYTRSLATLEAIKAISRRQPWMAQRLRATVRAETIKLATLANRYTGE